MTASHPPIEIRPSSRRKKTVAAQWSGDTIVVHVPARLPEADRQAWAEKLAGQLLAQRRRNQTASDDRLAVRAAELSEMYLGGQARPASVRWVSNQNGRWGSCTPSTGMIRISDRLRRVPEWVLDAVLVHELTHLIEANHSKKFQALVNRYPRVRDADLFLAGYSLGLAAAT